MRSVQLIGALLCLAATAIAQPLAASVTHEDEAKLTGDELYQRVLDNRFNSYVQKFMMHSGDRGGNVQTVEIDLKYLNFRGNDKKILSKSIAKYQRPQEVRHLGYLVINKASGADDQFVYRPSSRRVRRVNLRGEAVFGTDFSFEDILPQEFEDASYARIPDAQVDEHDCFVVEVTPRADSNPEYSKFVVYVDKLNYVPLRTLYWDDKGLKVKELNSDAESIARYQDVEDGEPKEVWMATESKIVHLQQQTYTELVVMELTPNPNLRQRDFSERELTSGH